LVPKLKLNEGPAYRGFFYLHKKRVRNKGILKTILNPRV
jgi:hypothetical protein